tara:strand:+ start:1888 stop:2151 length:264 start_codon:yes stop_codon:yes gene_type:complete
MSNNKTIENNYFSQVIVYVMPIISGLAHGDRVKACDLFESVIWKGMTASEHKKVGKVIAQLTRENLLPLVMIEKTVKNHRQFVIKHY